MYGVCCRYNWPYVVADGIIFVVIPGSIYVGAYIKLVETVSKSDSGNPHLNSDTALDKDLIQVILTNTCSKILV